MPRKGKRRREARRERREQVSRTAAGPEQQEATAAPQPAPRAEPVRAAARRPPARRRRGGGGFRLKLSPWWLAPPLVSGVVAVVLLLVLGGSSGSPTPTPTPDPRVAGQTPAVTLNLTSIGAETGSRFVPDSLTALAGQVIAIVVENKGTVSHNLRVSGPDKAYDTPDDFQMPPNVIKAGESQTLLVKIDEPGTYPFRCDFHPLDQLGTLILQ